MYKTAFNTTNSPIVVDTQGRQVGGGEWGPADSAFDGTQAAITNGTLTWTATEPDADSNPAYVEAHNRTQEMEARRKELQAASVKALREAAGDEDASKTELITQLAGTDTPVAEDTTKSKRGRS